MPENPILSEVFQSLREQLDQMDEIREKLLPLQRQTVRLSSEIIKNVHRGEFQPIKGKMEEASRVHKEMKNLLESIPFTFAKNYLQIASQELGEAAIFHSIIAEGRFKMPEEIGITVLDYAYSISDVIGELRRYVLKLIRDEDIGGAKKLFAYMEDIYSYMFTLDYPGGLIPGLRKKTDVARGILAKTEGDLTLSMSLLKVNQNILDFKNISEKQSEN